ncbi:hypothetical protein FRAHR75_1120026 [Frankia sp. Hr75.2]|nr:hypothetical protein FRAHR75_1120026 [Frankia sp. Hr75.2]
MWEGLPVTQRPRQDDPALSAIPTLRYLARPAIGFLPLGAALEPADCTVNPYPAARGR